MHAAKDLFGRYELDEDPEFIWPPLSNRFFAKSIQRDIYLNVASATDYHLINLFIECRNNGHVVGPQIDAVARFKNP